MLFCFIYGGVLKGDVAFFEDAKKDLVVYKATKCKEKLNIKMEQVVHCLIFERNFEDLP